MGTLPSSQIKTKEKTTTSEALTKKSSIEPIRNMKKTRWRFFVLFCASMIQFGCYFCEQAPAPVQKEILEVSKPTFIILTLIFTFLDVRYQQLLVQLLLRSGYPKHRAVFLRRLSNIGKVTRDSHFFSWVH